MAVCPHTGHDVVDDDDEYELDRDADCLHTDPSPVTCEASHCGW